MKLNNQDRLILESIVEEMMRRNNRDSSGYGFGRVQSSSDDRKNWNFNPTEYKDKRASDLSKSEEDTYDPKLGLVGSIRADAQKLLDHVVKYYGVDISEYNYPKDGSVVYRGHKHPDPFSKGNDAKASDDKVYFASNAFYAFGVYSDGFNPHSTQIGQTGFNTFQTRLQDPEDARWPASSSGNFKVGFFTIATPKDPDAIVWYSNFGYESYTKKPLNAEDPYNRSSSKFKHRGDNECVEPRSSFSKIRTYLIYDREKMVSFNTIKKYAPKLYDLIISSYVVGKDDTRVI
jgi:hypothetical protein